MTSPTIIAIDWSGAASGAASRIWLCEVRDGEVVRLENGRSREQIGEYLIDRKARDANLIVGLDFAFSFPSWFVNERAPRAPHNVWSVAEHSGEEWLTKCEPPFWGREGKGRPNMSAEFRQTDLDMPSVGGIRPKSIFQINGAGSVGTGSIRGMALLSRLHQAGFAIWPFDDAILPLVVEIYPRVLTGAVRKSDTNARRGYLEQYPQLNADILAAASSSEDAFDALIAAIEMDKHADDLQSLPRGQPPYHIEGKIWMPTSTTRVESPPRRQFDSSRTRVAPVFDALVARDSTGASWLPDLLDLCGSEDSHVGWRERNLTIREHAWGKDEKGLLPPVALLSWLVRNLPSQPRGITGDNDTAERRKKLADRDPDTIASALDNLRVGGSKSAWYVLEGLTYPDVFISTPDALIVIEGKRTEATTTTHTTWMPGRHQILRHLDAAWEIRGNRAVYGMLIVEAESESSAVPEKWREAARATTTPAAIALSLPHRSAEEQAGIAASFLGVTTWQVIRDHFNLHITL